MNYRTITRITRTLALVVATGAAACGGTEEGLRQGEIELEGEDPIGPDEEDIQNDFEEDFVDPEDLEDEFVEEDVDEEVEEELDPELLVAPFDNDSLQNPAVSELLRITGLRRLEYIDQISALLGDADDFVEFELPNNSNPSSRIRVKLDCDIEGDDSGQVRVTLYEDGEIDHTLRVLCNEGEKDLTVDNTKVQTARIYFAVTPGDQALVTYHLTVIGFR